MSDTPEADPRARLARIKAYVTESARMIEWEQWYNYSAGGGGAGWPRDRYAAVLQVIADLCDQPVEVAEERALTRDEQGMLHRALRRSLRIVG
jgi:hypothetical protein